MQGTSPQHLRNDSKQKGAFWRWTRRGGVHYWKGLGLFILTKNRKPLGDFKQISVSGSDLSSQRLSLAPADCGKDKGRSQKTN